MGYYCEECHNTGELDCYCGGDLCICTNYGVYPCPHCDGGTRDDEYEDDIDFPPAPIRKAKP